MELKSVDLLPCPFCGASARMRALQGYNGGLRVQCEDCDAQTWTASESEVATAWNRRASGWIPTAERIPADDETVIVEGGIAYVRNGEWWSLTGIEYPGRPIQWAVERWMPLPAPEKP